jgi:AcrR family transcriptional regulator
VATARANKYGEGREALLQATVAVVADRGLHGLTFRAVAERAGVNNTLILHHFGTKDVLLHEAVAWATTRAIGLSELSSRDDFGADFAQTVIDFVEADPQLQLFQYEFVLESRRRPELRPEAVALYEGYIAALEQTLIRRGHRSARTLARAIFAALDGLVFQQLTVADPEAVREAILRVGQLLDGEIQAGDAAMV